MLDYWLYASSALGFGFSMGFVADSFKSMNRLMLSFVKKIG